MKDITERLRDCQTSGQPASFQVLVAARKEIESLRKKLQVAQKFGPQQGRVNIFGEIA